MSNEILITGKTGTVGSNLDFGVGFPSKEFDLRNPSEAERLIRKFSPRAIVHCAAKVGGLQEHLSVKYRIFHDNLLINTNLIHYAKMFSVPRVLSFLSSCIFSDENELNNEGDIYNAEPFSIHRPYGHAKRMLEFHSRICYEEYGLNYNCVIPVNIYGLNDDFNVDTGHVIGVLIHRCYLAQKNNTDFVIWGDGSQQRQFLFTEDVKNLTQWALDNYLEKEPLIFCDNNLIRVKDIVDIIVQNFEFKGRVFFDKDKPSGQKSRRLDNSKLLSLKSLDFTPIEEGIQKTIEWFRNNYEIARK